MKPIRWTKQGLCIRPEEAPTWRATHSGMVSVLPWEDGCRLFLTGRDEAQRFQIGWLELRGNLEIARENTDNPILPAGRMGCFDCGGLCMPTVVRVSDSVLYLYYVGWGPSGGGIFCNNCGLAISRDNGATWQRWSEAPLALLDARDPIGIGTVFVLRQQPDYWRMWYTTFREWRPLPGGGWRHYYHIRYAESDNGIDWCKPAENLAVDFADDREYAVARPVVLAEEDGYRMWFCRRSEGSTYRIGYAESADGLSWRRRDEGIEPATEGWDSEMIEYAYVLKQPSGYLMFYNGNGFGATGTGAATGIGS